MKDRSQEPAPLEPLDEVFAPVLGSMFGRSNFTKKDIEHFHVLETSNPTDLKGATGIYARVLARLVRFPVLVTVASVILIVSICRVHQ